LEAPLSPVLINSAPAGHQVNQSVEPRFCGGSPPTFAIFESERTTARVIYPDPVAVQAHHCAGTAEGGSVVAPIYGRVTTFPIGSSADCVEHLFLNFAHGWSAGIASQYWQQLQLIRLLCCVT
jgi:hypothetical protein